MITSRECRACGEFKKKKSGRCFQARLRYGISVTRDGRGVSSLFLLLPPSLLSAYSLFCACDQAHAYHRQGPSLSLSCGRAAYHRQGLSLSLSRGRAAYHRQGLSLLWYGCLPQARALSLSLSPAVGLLTTGDGPCDCFRRQASPEFVRRRWPCMSASPPTCDVTHCVCVCVCVCVSSSSIALQVSTIPDVSFLAAHYLSTLNPKRFISRRSLLIT